MSILQKILKKYIANILFPSSCTLCKTNGICLCVNCEQELEKLHKNINSWTYACYNYKDQSVKNLLYRVKYHHNPDLGKLVGSHVRKKFEEFVSNSDYVLIPIPLSKNRMSERMYNQAYQISLGLAGDPGRIKNILIRKKDTHKLHSSHTIDQRVLELQDAFEVDDNLLIDNENTKYILIDDITTSGTTLYEARRTLINAGIKIENVFAFVLAH